MGAVETFSRAMDLMFERPAVLVPALVVMGLAALTLAVDAVWGKALVWNLSEGLVDLNVPLLVGLCIGWTVIRSWAVAATAMLVARATSEETFSLKQALDHGLRRTPSVFLLGLAGIVVGCWPARPFFLLDFCPRSCSPHPGLHCAGGLDGVFGCSAFPERSSCLCG